MNEVEAFVIAVDSYTCIIEVVDKHVVLKDLIFSFIISSRFRQEGLDRKVSV
jgi:hypothetical protein